MQAVTDFARFRALIPFDDVSFGCGGLHVFRPDELEEAQVGYSVAPDGSSLCTSEPGAWQPEWMVIGTNTGVGDPIFVDTSRHELPVLTAIHGEVSWDRMPVAPSLSAFGNSLLAFADLAKGRSNPVERDEKPITDVERNKFVQQLRLFNGSEQYLEFWLALLEY